MESFRRKELYYAYIEFHKDSPYVELYPYYNGKDLSQEEIPDFLFFAVKECIIAVEGKYRGKEDIQVLVMKKSLPN